MPQDPELIAAIVLIGGPLVAGLLTWAGLFVVDLVLSKRLVQGKVNFKPIYRPTILTVIALTGYFLLPSFPEVLSPSAIAVLTHAMSLIAIVAIGWLILTVTDAVGNVVSTTWDIDKTDNRKERAMLTKFRVMRRVWVGVIILCTVGAVLMTFPSIRSLGAGLLASAGVAGIVLGIALRPTLETFIASVQVALTEPINIDDVVIVENEWGRIEEIRPTYAVVRIWDDRRLIVPLTDFINKPFQNWTRSKSEITGVVTLKLDFKTPVDAVREKVKQFVEEDQNYDGRFWNVQITDADDKAMTLRVLCTAGNASKAWDLRCAVREKMITWLQCEHPSTLPRLRAEVGGLDQAEHKSDADDSEASS